MDVAMIDRPQLRERGSRSKDRGLIQKTHITHSSERQQRSRHPASSEKSATPPRRVVISPIYKARIARRQTRASSEHNMKMHWVTRCVLEDGEKAYSILRNLGLDVSNRNATLTCGD
jgi:hypothetical protein